jgi:phage shock protein E
MSQRKIVPTPKRPTRRPIKGKRSRWPLILGGAVVVAVIAVIVAVAAGSSSSSDDSSKHLSVSAFASRVASPGVIVVDVRTPSEYASGHIANAVNIDVEDSTFDSRLAALDESAKYAVYCHSGNRSAVALQKMTAGGFTDIADLSGGISAWTAAGRPATTQQPVTTG